ncbi:uncharacterized protein LOC144510901 [Mustelus asterias]
MVLFAGAEGSRRLRESQSQARHDFALKELEPEDQGAAAKVQMPLALQAKEGAKLPQHFRNVAWTFDLPVKMLDMLFWPSAMDSRHSHVAIPVLTPDFLVNGLGLKLEAENSRTNTIISSILGVLTVSQSIVTQFPPVLSLAEGSSVKLSCRIQGSRTAIVFWYMQPARKDITLVYRAGKYLKAFDRFSSEILENKNIYSLIIAETRRDDSGMYYCAIRNQQMGSVIFGNGSKLVITAGSPAVFLLIPPLDEIPAMEWVPLLCLVRGVSADSFSVRWNVSGRETGGMTDSGTMEQDGTYTVRSYISFSAETWSSGIQCTCAVRINSNESILSESVSSQRNIPVTAACIVSLSGGLVAAALLILGLFFVAGRRSCRNRQRGNANSDAGLAGSREHRQNEESVYARLAFNEDPTL